MSSESLEHERNVIFSIIIPTYKRPLLLLRAVNSALNQSFENYEIIIVIDGKDSYYDYINDLKKNKKIKIIFNPRNKGVANSRNIGLKAANGKYISFLDDDDEYLPTFLSATYEVLRNSSAKVGMSWCNVKLVHNLKIATNAQQLTYTEYSSNDVSERELFENFFDVGIGYGVTIKSKCLNDIGLFNEKYNVIEDTELFCRFLLKNYSPVVIPGVHIIIHKHNGDRLTDTSNNLIRINRCELLFEEYKQLFDKYSYLKSKLRQYVQYLKDNM